MMLAANVALLVLAALVTAFAGIYLCRSPWWKNSVGRSCAAMALTLSAVLVQITFASWVSADFQFRQQIRFAIYAIGALGFMPMIWSLLREQRADRLRRREHSGGGVL